MARTVLPVFFANSPTFKSVRLSADHHAIDADFYRQLAEVFTAAQIIELGFSCAQSMGLHRFIHTLEVFGTDDPVIAFSPDQVDTRHAVSDPVDASV